MSKKIAMIFPGQGSQKVGMLAQLAVKEPLVVDVFQRASRVLDVDLWQIVQENPDNQLNQTAYTQPALLAASFAIWQVWLARGGSEPSVMAGHSLGEYSALVCAGAINFEDAIMLVHKRGQYMQEAVPQGKGAMAAIIGLSPDKVIDACELAKAEGVVQPANFNANGQIVVSGEVEAVKQAMSHAKNLGAKLAKLLPVSVPSHCLLMQPAAQRLASDLDAITMKLPTISVLHNVDVEVSGTIEALKQNLVKQLYSPVRWVETVEKMEKEGIVDCFECGPGKVLAGLNKRISKFVITREMDSDEALCTAEETLA